MKNTFKKSKTNDKYVGIFPFEFDDSKKDGGALPDVIHLVPVGQWEHDMYGPIIITASDIEEFIVNFNAGVRKGVFITCGHEGFQELPAAGWVTKVEKRPDGLWGYVDWNEIGKNALKNKEFKFFSPEMCRDYEDPETHQFYRNVLTGGALTKSPYFKELQAIVFSEKTLQTKFNQTQETMKTLQEILAIEDIATLTEEERQLVKDSVAELSDDQKAKYASFLEVETPAETEEEKTAREAKEKEDADAAALVAETPAEIDPAEDPQKMSDKNAMVTINASELALLRQKADQGAQAFKELEKAEIAGAVEKMVFSATNQAGAFLPKSKTAIETFMGTLNKAQRTAFAAIVKEIPASEKFKEIGSGDAATADTTQEVESKVAEKMKLNDKLSYSEALKQVMSENKGLEERYDRELPSARKA